MELRNYQNDLLNRIYASWTRGNRKVIAVAPCGFGKTVLASEIAHRTVKNGKRVAIILPRQEIMEQTISTVGNTDGVYIGMTITTANRLNTLPDFDLIIYDECHLSVANTYWKISNAFPSAYVLGLTASPIRTDDRPLGDLYEDIVCGVDTRWLIDNGRLAPYRYYSVPVVNDDVIDNNSVHYEDVMLSPTVYGQVIESYRQFAEGLQTVCYCTSIRHSKAVAELFNENGIKARHLDGSTPDYERKSVIDSFRRGEIKVLSNCDLISMGFDMPDIGCVMLMRPTNSTALYVQQSGRALRYKEGKTAVIIDMVGNYARFGMPDDRREWSLTASAKKRKQMDDQGNLTLRTCPNCYMVFKTADICPFCGAKYPISAREIRAREEITLQEIKRQERENTEEIRKEKRREVGRCRTMDDLWRIAAERGYSSGWVWHTARAKGIMR